MHSSLLCFVTSWSRAFSLIRCVSSVPKIDPFQDIRSRIRGDNIWVMTQDIIRKLEATREKYSDVRKPMDCDRRYEIRCNDRGLSRRHGARSARDRKIAITFSAWIIYSSSWSYLPHVHVTQARVKHPLFRNYIHNCVRMKYTNYVHTHVHIYFVIENIFFCL